MIGTLRQVVHDMLVATATVPVYRWLPGSADDLPALVVGRPNVTEGDQRALVQTTVPVHVLGRTLRDDEAQAELDDLADYVLTTLWTPPPTEGVGMRLTTITAAVIEVAGTDIPAYTALVVCTSTFCP